MKTFADILITDYSSIAVDHLTSNKPIGFFLPYIMDYDRGFMSGAMERPRDAGPQLDSVEALERFVRQVPRVRGAVGELEQLCRTDVLHPSSDKSWAVGLHELVAAEPARASFCPHLGV